MAVAPFLIHLWAKWQSTVAELFSMFIFLDRENTGNLPENINNLFYSVQAIYLHREILKLGILKDVPGLWNVFVIF